MGRMDEWFVREDDIEEEELFGADSVTTEREEVSESSRSYEGRHGVGDSVYSPAFSVLMATVFGGVKTEEIVSVGDRRLTWWEDSSVVPKADVTLVNPFTWAQSHEVPENLTKDVLGMDPDEQFIFSDSGGFQATSFDGMEIVNSPDLHDWRNFKVYPERLLEWQVENASAGVILDYGPYQVQSNQGETEGLGEIDPRDFEEELYEPNLQMTIEHSQRMHDRWKEMDAGNFKLYNVAQSVIPFEHQTYEPDHYIRDWYERIDRVGDFAGWGIGTGANNIGKLALNLCFIAEEMTEDHLHFFGTSSLTYRALIEYWRLWKGDEFAITLDSTSFEVGSQYRQMFSSMGQNADLTVSSRETDSESVVADVTPCTCSVCATMEREFGPTWVWDIDDAKTGVAINLHNLNMLRSRHRTITALVQGAGWDLPERYNEDTSQDCPFWKIMCDSFGSESIEKLRASFELVKRARETSMDEAKEHFIFRSAWDDSEGPVIEKREEIGGFDSW